MRASVDVLKRYDIYNEKANGNKVSLEQYVQIDYSVRVCLMELNDLDYGNVFIYITMQTACMFVKSRRRPYDMNIRPFFAPQNVRATSLPITIQVILSSL